MWLFSMTIKVNESKDCEVQTCPQIKNGTSDQNVRFWKLCHLSNQVINAEGFPPHVFVAHRNQGSPVLVCSGLKRKMLML